MFRYLVRRILWAVVLFIAVTMVTYVIFFIIPANPARLACGQRATQDCLGRSFTNRQSVNHVIAEAAPVTASLLLGGVVFWMMLAVPIGILSALRPRSLLDRLAMVFVLVGISA